ncbi:MAG: NADH-quinone oxidoreductase subunit NuoG [Burkholderiaceae bacterium]
MLEIEIDGKKVEVPEGSMVMDAANRLGTYIPHFCYHKKLSIAANCRMCLVEVEKAPKALPACATPVTQGMVVRTHSEKAIQAQKDVMQFLLINHPLDCPICDQGGECQLQDLAVGYGPSSSRYQEEKRVVHAKEEGPLISMKEMSRCIHCTRCVRFGQEVAGVMEFGMLGRGQHSEISSFVNSSVSSELSGNMIDLCPVGALTSKPFRYSARTWELSRRKSVSPHDSLGANLIVQVKGNKVMRVLPLENEAVNECWLSDRDRFAYEGLNSEDRLTTPMIKQGGEWQSVDWQTALEYVAQGLRGIRDQYGADAIASVAAPYATLEELTLLAKLTRGLGSDHIDFRLRQSAAISDATFVPWLGMPIAEVSQLRRVFVIGSHLRKDHPLLTARLRAAVQRSGAQLSLLNANEGMPLMAVANQLIAAPSDWVRQLAEVATAVAQIKNISVPTELGKLNPSSTAVSIANSLMSGEPRAVLLGNAAAHHPQTAQLHALAQWIAQHTHAKFGYLTEAANTVGGYLANALPADRSVAQSFFDQPKKAYLVLHAEPALDCANPQQARAALDQAEMVVVMSPYQHGMEYADVLLPVSPFSETSGTFVNAEGRVQGFNGSTRPLADTRPAWKVLRVLGNLLSLGGFNYESSEDIRAELLGARSIDAVDVSGRLNNLCDVSLPSPAAASTEPERAADVPLYFTDAIVRRAASLQQTADARPPRAILSTSLAQKIGVAEGEQVRLKQGSGSAVLPCAIDASQPAQVVRIAAGHRDTSTLGPMFGAISVEKA